MSQFPNDGSIELRLTQEDVAEFLDMDLFSDIWNVDDTIEQGDSSDDGGGDALTSEVQREQRAMSGAQQQTGANPFQSYPNAISAHTPVPFNQGLTLAPRDHQYPGGGAGASLTRRSSVFGKHELEIVGCYIFRKSPSPEANRLKKIAAIVAERYGNLSKKRVLSQLRAFLRRKRELVGNKMITAMRRFQRKCSDRAQFRREIESDDQLIMDIIDEAQEGFENQALGIEFCRTKLLAFLDRQSL